MALHSLEGKEVLVIGLGVTGMSAAQFCAARGARVTAADERPREALGDLAGMPAGVELSIGVPLPDFDRFDLLVPSPGVPQARYRDAQIPAWGDIEIAGRALPIPIVAVSGTNGKSTTVCLIEAMLRGAGLRAQAAGNLGTAALSLVGAPLDVAVLEVSSFQLESVDAFRPRVSVVLNLTPDHLDRHGDMDGYAAAKARLLRRQGPEDVAVLNADDPRVWAMSESVDCRARIVGFSRTRPLERGVYADSGCAVVADESGTRRVSIAAPSLPGPHNLENILASFAAVSALGDHLDLRRAARALARFRGLPHRCEIVGRVGGITYVNDSKATNPDAAARSLASFDGPVWWIAGGRDKGLDFAALAGAAADARSALLIGEAADNLAAVLDGVVPVHHCGDLTTAVQFAHSHADPGDIVLLSPACASFDQFKGFADRGDQFRALVQGMDVDG